MKDQYKTPKGRGSYCGNPQPPKRWMTIGDHGFCHEKKVFDRIGKRYWILGTENGKSRHQNTVTYSPIKPKDDCGPLVWLPVNFAELIIYSAYCWSRCFSLMAKARGGINDKPV